MFQWILIFIVAMLVAGKLYKIKFGHVPEWKYFKPYSLTWWSVATPGALGILISGEPFHGWEALAMAASETVHNFAPPGTIPGEGPITPQAMIGFSAIGVGGLGKVGK